MSDVKPFNSTGLQGAAQEAAQKMQRDLLLPRDCFCIGPQNGEPKCPCAMRNVDIIDGRYIERARDLGPVLQDAKGWEP